MGATSDPQKLDVTYRISGIARPVDPSWPTNKAMLVIIPVALVLGLIHALVEGDASIGQAVLTGLNAGLIAFLCWALTRELSPEDNPAAFVAVAVMAGVWTRVGDQSILIPAITLTAVRIVNRSTGKPAELGDSLIVAAGAGAMTWFLSWTSGVVVVLALVFDALLEPPGRQPSKRALHLALAGALAVVVAIRVGVGVAPPRWPAHLQVFGTIAVLGMLAALAYPRPRSVGDVDQVLLSPARVRAGIAIGVLATALASVDPALDLTRLAAPWACVLALVLGLPLVALRRLRAG